MRPPEANTRVRVGVTSRSPVPTQQLGADTGQSPVQATQLGGGESGAGEYHQGVCAVLLGDLRRGVETDVGRQVHRHLGRAGQAHGDDLVAAGDLQLEDGVADVAGAAGEHQARTVPSDAEQGRDCAREAEGHDQLRQRQGVWGLEPRGECQHHHHGLEAGPEDEAEPGGAVLVERPEPVVTGGRQDRHPADDGRRGHLARQSIQGHHRHRQRDGEDGVEREARAAEVAARVHRRAGRDGGGQRAFEGRRVLGLARAGDGGCGQRRRAGRNHLDRDLRHAVPPPGAAPRHPFVTCCEPRKATAPGHAANQRKACTPASRDGPHGSDRSYPVRGMGSGQGLGLLSRRCTSTGFAAVAGSCSGHRARLGRRGPPHLVTADKASQGRRSRFPHLGRRDHGRVRRPASTRSGWPSPLQPAGRTPPAC